MKERQPSNSSYCFIIAALYLALGKDVSIGFVNKVFNLLGLDCIIEYLSQYSYILNTIWSILTYIVILIAIIYSLYWQYTGWYRRH